MSAPTRSKLLSSGFKNFLNKPALSHPQRNLTVQFHNAEVRANMLSTNNAGAGSADMPKTSEMPGEHFEPRQTATSEDYTPDVRKSIRLSVPRQRLVDDVGFTSQSSALCFTVVVGGVLQTWQSHTQAKTLGYKVPLAELTKLSPGTIVVGTESSSWS